jgi:transcriptional regulator with XRE-family HTH domain
MDTQGRRLGQRMAAEIRAEMARQGISRRQLAETIGESHVTVGRWVKGETAMSLDVTDAICRALGLTVADLLSAVERNGGYEPVTRSATEQGSGRTTGRYGALVDLVA